MLEIRITAPEISEAINNLANALAGGKSANTESATFPVIGSQSATERTGVAVAPGQTCAPSTNPVQNVVSYTAPVNTGVPDTGAVPTAAPQYTLEMLAVAGTELVDAGRINELSAILAKFGVEALTSLDPANYGAVALELRKLGAAI